MCNVILFVANLDAIILRFRLFRDAVGLSVFAEFAKPLPRSCMKGYVFKTYSMIDYVNSEAGNLNVVG